MISLASGAPYSDLPTAYLYKQPGTPRPQGCGCNRPKDFGSFAGNPVAKEAVQSTPVVPTDAGATSEKPIDAEDKKVRVVGPTFLPDPGAAIDLQAPAPTQVR